MVLSDFDEVSSIKDSCTSVCHHHPHLSSNSISSRPPSRPAHSHIGAPDGALPPEPTCNGNGHRKFSSDRKPRKPLSPVARALKGVEFIAQHIKKTDQDIEVFRQIIQTLHTKCQGLSRLLGIACCCFV